MKIRDYLDGFAWMGTILIVACVCGKIVEVL